MKAAGGYRADGMKARIVVTPKKTVLDPQGKAVAKAIQELGVDCVTGARVGRYIELELSATDPQQARQKLEGVCKDLLSNPIIEEYRLEVD